MAYTPELTYQDSCTLRRIAWAMKMPMTRAMNKVFEYLPKILDREKVCEGCRDKSKCEECAFCAHNQTQQKGDGGDSIHPPAQEPQYNGAVFEEHRHGKGARRPGKFALQTSGGSVY